MNIVKMYIHVKEIKKIKKKEEEGIRKFYPLKLHEIRDKRSVTNISTKFMLLQIAIENNQQKIEVGNKYGHGLNLK